MKPNDNNLLPAADDTASKILVDVQSATTRVKQVVTECVSSGASEGETTKRLNETIALECKRVNGELKEQMRRALVVSARKWHYELKQTYRTLDRNLQQSQRQPLDIDINNLLRMTPFQRNVEFRKILDDGMSPGIPIIRDYQKSVKIALKAMAAEPPKVVTRKDGKTYVMPLRNRAEMAVRYDANVKSVRELQSRGVKYAWTSSHPNCSPRCRDFQGRLWSLEGKTGEIDGIHYDPIEKALRGKEGDGNGIISGYNCRHRLIGYTPGSRPPEDFSESEIKREYAIDKQQRSYENRIRQMKTEERQLRAAGLTKEAADLRKRWRKLNIDYEVYSLENDRAFYRYRCVIDRDEIPIENRGLTKNDESDIIKDNNELRPPKLANIKLGEEMSFEDANFGKVNPKFQLGGGFTINCQSCVVCYEARLRGYDAETLPNYKNAAAEELSHKTNLAWIDPESGEYPEYILDKTANTPIKFKKFLESVVEPKRRYTLEFSWKGRGNSGHIISVDKINDNSLRFYDPQTGKSFRGVEINRYLNRLKYKTTVYGQKIPLPPKLLRVDNLKFNSKYVDKIIKESDKNDEKSDN